MEIIRQVTFDMKQNSNRRNLFFLISAGMLILLDQITKWLAQTHLMNQEDISLIPGVFELHYLENRSAAFGLDPISLFHQLFHISYFDEHPDVFLNAKMIFFVVLTMVVVLLLVRFFLRIPNEKRYDILKITLVLFVSGAIGNLIDRISHRYVVDFFYFRLIDFPVFNVADIYVTLAAGLLIVLSLFYYKEEDFDQIFPSRKKDSDR